MPDSHSAHPRRSLSPIVVAAISTGGSFLAILVGLLTANKNPTVVAWVVGATAALAVGVLTFLQARVADRERTDLQKEIARLQLRLTEPSVELLEPSEGDGSRASEMKIRGRVFIEGLPASAIGSILRDRKLEIVPFVKPTATTYGPADKWFSQNVARIDETTGEISGLVRIGTDQHGMGENFRIILAIISKGYIFETDTPFDHLPENAVRSNPVNVSRLR